MFRSIAIMSWQAVATVTLCLLSAHSFAAPVSGQGTWETTLQARDADPSTPGIEAYYDTVLNITWVADANLAKTSGYDADGLMDWDTAQAWIASLNAASYLGANNWRLPTVMDTGAPGCDFSDSGTDCGFNMDVATGEMVRMFYSTLGNTTAGVGDPCFSAAPPACLTNTGPFSNLGPFSDPAPGDYWSGTEYAPNTSEAWTFNFSYGFQIDLPKSMPNYPLYAWAVRPGDIVVFQPTVVIGGCDSGVPNYNVAPGTTLNDAIAQCAATAKNKGKFVSCVSALTSNSKKASLITGAQKGAIMSCAAKAP